MTAQFAANLRPLGLVGFCGEPYMLRVMTKLLSLSLLLSLFAVGCTSDTSAEPAKNNEPAKSDVPAKNDVPATNETPKKVVGPTAQEVAVFDAKCGCSIDGVGHCGNYILIEGKYVPLIHPSLGKMEFCQHKDAGVKIEVAGSMKDGKYVADQWKLAK